MRCRALFFLGEKLIKWCELGIGDQSLQVVVMRVSIHCQGCAGKVKKHIAKMEGNILSIPGIIFPPSLPQLLIYHLYISITDSLLVCCCSSVFFYQYLYVCLIVRTNAHCGLWCTGAGVTSFSIDLESKRVTVMGHISPVGVLESISKVKKAEFWQGK